MRFQISENLRNRPWGDDSEPWGAPIGDLGAQIQPHGLISEILDLWKFSESPSKAGGGGKKRSSWSLGIGLWEARIGRCRRFLRKSQKTEKFLRFLKSENFSQIGQPGLGSELRSELLGSGDSKAVGEGWFWTILAIFGSKRAKKGHFDPRLICRFWWFWPSD